MLPALPRLSHLRSMPPLPCRGAGVAQPYAGRCRGGLPPAGLPTFRPVGVQVGAREIDISRQALNPTLQLQYTDEARKHH